MEMKRVYKGSVAAAGIEEHGGELCMQRFCSGGRDRGHGNELCMQRFCSIGEDRVTWKSIVYHKVLFQTCCY